MGIIISVDMYKDDLASFLDLNDISLDILRNSLYRDILETILGGLCEKSKKSKQFEQYLRNEFRTFNNELATKRVLEKTYGLMLTDSGNRWLSKCLVAFLRKKSRNLSLVNALREPLWEKQNNQCAFCGKKLKLSETHVDHIIPYDYVGDELEDNYQILCSDCNEHKSNHVGIAMKKLIFERGEANEKS